MHIGALVAKKSRWDISANLIGVVVAKSPSIENGWLVLWTQNESNYKLQEHIAEALLDLNSVAESIVKARTCISI